MVYDDPSSPQDQLARRRKRRRRRRDSYPSSDRPRPPRSRRRDAQTRSPSPISSSSDIEELPPRFDREGYPLDARNSTSRNSRGMGMAPTMSGGLGDILAGLGGGGGARGNGKQEMVERVVRDLGDVVEGRKSWRDMVGGLLGAGGA